MAKTIWPLPTTNYLPVGEIEESRPVALVTSGPAWQSVRSKFHLPVAWKAEVVEATTEAWDSQGEDLQGEVIYAVGGGLAADAAKYLSWKKEIPMVCVPTALSVDAFITWASGVRAGGCVRYIETKVPEELILDLELLASAPASIRAAGICDVLSIATGSWDWQFAHKKGVNPAGMEYLPYVAQAAQAILQGALDCAEAAGAGDPQGLKQVYDCLALEVQLCNQVGHARPEEGSEHYFAYAVENVMGHGLPHADLLGPGILLIASLQGQETEALKQAMQACHIQLDSIPIQVQLNTLMELPSYARRHGLPYGISHEIDSDLIRFAGIFKRD